MAFDAERLVADLRGMLCEVMRRGWSTPVHFCIQAANGAVLAGTWESYDDVMPPTFSVDYHPRAPAPPMAVCFVDATSGEVAGWVITADDVRRFPILSGKS